MEPKALRVALRIWVALVLAFLFIPIVLIVLYAFNQSNIESWPISHFTLHWFSLAWHDPQVRAAFLLSVRVGLFATALALLLGSAIAYALNKFRFFGRETISLLLVLPLALPGIITGIVLALARIAGETAPLLFTSFNNRYWSTSLTEPMSALTVQVYSYAKAAHEDWHRQAWAGALVLVTIVLLCSIIARFATRRLERMH